MYCKYCGKEIPQQAAFCPYCGKKKVEPSNSMTVDAPVEKQPKQHKKKWLIALGILVVLAAGIMLVQRMTTNNKIASKLQGTDWWWSSTSGTYILRLNPDGTGVWIDSNHYKLTLGLVTYTIEEDRLFMDEYEYQWNSNDEDVQKYTTEFYWDDDTSQFAEVDPISEGGVTCTLTPADQGTFSSEMLRIEAAAVAAGESPDGVCDGIGNSYEGKLYNTLCQGYWYIYDDDIITRWNCCIELTFNPNGVGSMKLRDLTTGEINMNPYGAGNNINNAQYAPFFYKLDEDHVYIVMIDGDLLLCSLQDGKLVTVQDSEFQIAPILHYKSRPDISAIQADSETAKHK